jgi:hypothetical protein
LLKISSVTVELKDGGTNFFQQILVVFYKLNLRALDITLQQIDFICVTEYLYQIHEGHTDCPGFGTRRNCIAVVNVAAANVGLSFSQTNQTIVQRHP